MKLAQTKQSRSFNGFDRLHWLLERDNRYKRENLSFILKPFHQAASVILTDRVHWLICILQGAYANENLGGSTLGLTGSILQYINVPLCTDHSEEGTLQHNVQ
jgi:hypothetical protein